MRIIKNNETEVVNGGGVPVIPVVVTAVTFVAAQKGTKKLIETAKKSVSESKARVQEKLANGECRKTRRGLRC